jgi:hypothetical protein
MIRKKKFLNNVTSVLQLRSYRQLKFVMNITCPYRSRPKAKLGKEKTYSMQTLLSRDFLFCIVAEDSTLAKTKFSRRQLLFPCHGAGQAPLPLPASIFMANGKSPPAISII